jgi:hypothetical protein
MSTSITKGTTSQQQMKTERASPIAMKAGNNWNESPYLQETSVYTPMTEPGTAPPEAPSSAAGKMTGAK